MCEVKRQMETIRVCEVWIIQESPHPGVWNVLQSRGIYKSEKRAKKVAEELTRWHLENLPSDNPKHGWRYRHTEFIPKRNAENEQLWGQPNDQVPSC